jgi:hypothetical protein
MAGTNFAHPDPSTMAKQLSSRTALLVLALLGSGIAHA